MEKSQSCRSALSVFVWLFIPGPSIPNYQFKLIVRRIKKNTYPVMVEDLADFTLLVFLFKYHQVKFIKFSPLLFIAEDRSRPRNISGIKKRNNSVSSLIYREYWSSICLVFSIFFFEKRLDLILLQKSCSKSSPRILGSSWEENGNPFKKKEKNLDQNSGTSAAKLLK